MIAVGNNSQVLDLYVPDDCKTEKVCKRAVEFEGMALKHVPEKLKTKELCEIAVKTSGEALKYVPPKLRNAEMRKIAAMNLRTTSGGRKDIILSQDEIDVIMTCGIWDSEKSRWNFKR
jgi:hypothetical protein